MFKYVFSVFLLIFGIGCVVEGARNQKENIAFQNHGEITQIRSIENQETYAVYKQKSVFDEKKYVGVYHKGEVTFRTKAGKTVTVPSRGLPLGLLDAVQSGQTVTIWYLPEKPTTIRFADRNKPANEEKIFGIFLAVLGGYYVVRAARR
jgi:hypothetical protein